MLRSLFTHLLSTASVLRQFPLHSPVTTPAIPRPDASKLTACLDSAGIAYLTVVNGSAWTDASAAYNMRLAYTPAAIAQPTSAQQVSAAVTCAVRTHFFVNPRSGHHSYASSSLGGEDDHFILDLSALNTIALNGDIASIDGGARLGDVGLSLAGQERAVAMGICPYVGIGGHAAYGGWGFTSRMHGLVLDQLRSLEVVTADGEIRTVGREGPESDMFWALSGASGSFGIITKFNLVTHPAPPSTVFAIYNYTDISAAESARVISLFQTYCLEHAPAEFGTDFRIFRGRRAGTVLISIIITYVGPLASYHRAVVQPLIESLPVQPSNTTVSAQGYRKTLELLAFGQSLNTSAAPDYRDSFYAKSVMTPEEEPLTDEAILALMEYLAREGHRSTAYQWSAKIELWGGRHSAINAVPRNATAFVHRSSLFNFQLYATDYAVPFPESTIELVDGMQSSLVDAMGEEWRYEAYQNYVDPRLSAEDGHALYYAENHARLQDIKQKYDSQDVFRIKPDSLAIHPHRA